MRRLFLLALLVTACGGNVHVGPPDSGTPPPPVANEPPQLQGITAAHNTARANVDPPAATAIPELTWDDTLAAAAQQAADQCRFVHSGGPYGENLFASSAGVSAQTVVNAWVNEKADYHYASNTCSRVCGHYTQVVWAASRRVGCALANCTVSSPFGHGAWKLVFCEYDPPGNVNGERPY